MFCLLGFGTQNHAEFSSPAQKQKKITKNRFFQKRRKKSKKSKRCDLRKRFEITQKNFGGRMTKIAICVLF